jgi:hypothetical protein
MTLDYEIRCIVLKVMPYVQQKQMASLFALHITHELCFSKSSLQLQQGMQWWLDHFQQTNKTEVVVDGVVIQKSPIQAQTFLHHFSRLLLSRTELSR